MLVARSVNEWHQGIGFGRSEPYTVEEHFNLEADSTSIIKLVERCAPGESKIAIIADGVSAQAAARFSSEHTLVDPDVSFKALMTNTWAKDQDDAKWRPGAYAIAAIFTERLISKGVSFVWAGQHAKPNVDALKSQGYKIQYLRPTLTRDS
ncbi:MAG: hypothetical protein KDK48_05690 [Chlamydiia bacterium]|nr:hypothetical protein [Chlamydiia bacterium]